MVARTGNQNARKGPKFALEAIFSMWVVLPYHPTPSKRATGQKWRLSVPPTPLVSLQGGAERVALGGTASPRGGRRGKRDAVPRGQGDQHGPRRALPVPARNARSGTPRARARTRGLIND